MGKIGFWISLFALGLAAIKADAQDNTKPVYETVVEATSFNSASKVILDEEAIKKSKAPNIPSLLATHANISVVNSSFQPSSIFLRGGDSSHILILIDGLPFYDASTVQRTFNLNEFDIRTVKRIEIIKGSQSVLYGGQALAGVIKIDTIPDEIKSQSSILLEAGQREHRKISLQGLKAFNDEQGLMLRAQYTEKANRSPLKESDVKYRSDLVTADLGYFLLSDYDVWIKTSYISDFNEAAGSFGPLTVDTVGFNTKNQYGSVMSGLRYTQSPLRPQLLVSYQNNIRKFEQSPLNLPPNGVDMFYRSGVLNVRGEIYPWSRERAQLRIGTSYAKEAFIERLSGFESANETQELTGVFAKYDRNFYDNLKFEGGVRSDFKPGLERVDTFQVGLTLYQDLKFEFGTGFKTPSLFQTYADTYGTQGLKPEKSQTYSLTYGRQLTELQNFSVTVFETSFSNLISYQGMPPTGRYVNVAKVSTRGVEGQYTYRTDTQMRLDLNATYQEAWDVVNANWLARRPLQSGSVRFSKELPVSDFGIELVAVGERVDRTRLPGYAILNAFYNREFSDSVSGYLRGQNIADRRYEQTSGYHDEGAFWVVGIEIKN